MLDTAVATQPPTTAPAVKIATRIIAELGIKSVETRQGSASVSYRSRSAGDLPIAVQQIQVGIKITYLLLLISTGKGKTSKQLLNREVKHTRHASPVP